MLQCNQAPYNVTFSSVAMSFSRKEEVSAIYRRNHHITKEMLANVVRRNVITILVHCERVWEKILS